MKISDFFLKKIYDSRGNPTLEVEVVSGKNLSFTSAVPAGKSKSKKEAICLDFSKITGKKYLAKLQLLKNKSFSTIRSFDNFLLNLDGTKNKSNLGGNVMLGLSLAFARALAFEKKVSFASLVENEFFKENYGQPWNPVIFSNFINGGRHSSNNLDIQEYLVLAPVGKNANKTIEDLIRLYNITGEVLKKKFKTSNLPIGDEGGYALDFKDNFEPLFILKSLIRKHHFSSFALGLDAAANSFWKQKSYFFGNKKLKATELEKVYLYYFSRIENLESIEDPFAESEEKSFKSLKEKLFNSKMVVGDDLISSSAQNLLKYRNCVNGVIIKPNQVGTITEAMETCILAKALGMRTIFSHRSGETEDNFIVELAYAARSFGIKIGAPARERIAKFNQIIRLLTQT